MEGFGFLSILPPLTAIVLAIATRQVYISLFIAIWLGATFLTANPVEGFFRSIDTYMLAKIADAWYIAILIFTMVIAGTLGLVTRAGGAQAIANVLARKAKTARGGMLSAWLMGMIIFFDDYASCLIAGNTARPITDKVNISREKLSYIIDSTAAPVATIALISTWIGFELGVIGEGYAAIGMEDVPVYLIFLQSIPFRFYSIFTLALVLILSITMKDYGPMYDAEVRARTTGKLLRDGAEPLSATDTAVLQPEEGTPLRWFNFVIPIAVIIVSTFIGLYIHGGGAEVGWMTAFGDADSSIVLLWASSLGALVTVVMVLIQRIVPLHDAIDTLINGAKSVFPALIVLVLAWTLSSVTEELGAAEYLVGLVQAAGISAALLPFLIFLISCLVSFAMGTSWGTMGIVTPLAIPVAYAIGGPDFLIPTLAAVLTGAIFGDHCSPISDTTILSSTGAGSDHIDHVRTQLPYAVTGAVVAGVFGFIPAGLGVHPLISIVVGLIVLIVFVKLVGKPSGSVESIEASKVK
ncbi:MAG TPA: Na+/H+ antiporter NhaC family protein [Candidatus Limnocylindrales bacterium]|nr:Na+/H+ antiporter NhaC family protein [Candidatus Limnocylindrales bacterium]